MCAPSRRGRFRATAACAIGLFVVSLSAHDGVVEQIAALSARIVQQPSNAELLVRRADLYRQEKKFGEGLTDLDRADRLNPALPTSRLTRARLLFDKGDWRPAEQSATEFLDRQPRNVEGLLVRARARLRLGNASGAISDFTSALEVRPDPDTYLERAGAQLNRKPPQVEAALGGLDEGIARLGSIVTLQLEAIDLELRLRRYDAALARLDKVAAQAARKETWLARRGAILEQAGRLADARASYRAALDAVQASAGRRPPSRATLQLAQQVSANLERLDARALPTGGRDARLTH
jgi:tetratricopeptide (TPR) repeat protein